MDYAAEADLEDKPVSFGRVNPIVLIVQALFQQLRQLDCNLFFFIMTLLRPFFHTIYY